jgi:hypothetical protein
MPDTERKVVTSESYDSGDEVEQSWVDLQDGDGSVLVEQKKPVAIMNATRRYGVESLLKNQGGPEDIDVERLLKEKDLMGFITNVVVPSVLKPNAYWGDPQQLLSRLDPDVEADLRDRWDFDTMADGRVEDIVGRHLDGASFDLTNLSGDDFSRVMAAIIGGVDADRIRQGADDIDNQFRR